VALELKLRFADELDADEIGVLFELGLETVTDADANDEEPGEVTDVDLVMDEAGAEAETALIEEDTLLNDEIDGDPAALVGFEPEELAEVDVFVEVEDEMLDVE
jgi:hypothetical protein